MVFDHLDKKRTKIAVEAALERYRIYKYLTFEEREASTTASYSDTPRSITNVTSDQTASIAIYNVDEHNKRVTYCERVEQAIERLPHAEKFLIEQRYLCKEADYITDYNVYCFKFDPPISEKTYAKIRWRALAKLALNMNIGVPKGDDGDGIEVSG